MTQLTFASLLEAYAKALEKAILRHPENFALRPDEPIGAYAQRTARKMILKARHGGSRSILLGLNLRGVIRRLGFAPTYTGLDECLKAVSGWPEGPAPARPVPDACPTCGGPPVFLGTLGAVEHWRCRHCGITFDTGSPT